MLTTENNRNEYKRSINDGLEKEVVAFLNYKEGGTIFIGVDNDGSVIGVENCDEIQLKIKDRLISNISPNIMGLFDIVCETIEDKQIIKISLASGSEKPYYIKNKGMSESGCYIRIGSSAQPMTTHMIEDLFRKRVHNTIADMPSRYQDLTFNQLRIYYEGQGKSLNDNFARTLELLTSEGKYNYLAYILSDNNNLSVRYGEYWDETKVKLRKLNEYGSCSIIKALNSVLDKLNIVNDTFARITDAPEREERKLVNPVALREVIINAFVHNDYTRGDTPIIEQFSDRFVITSYGTLPAGLTQDDFFNGVSSPKNRELMRIFKDLELVEQLGSGMNRVMKVYDRSNFEFLDTAIRVTLPFNKEFDNPKENSKGESKGESKVKILNELKNNPKITIPELAKSLGISVGGIEKNMRLLKKENKIRRIGSTKAGYWEVIKK